MASVTPTTDLIETILNGISYTGTVTGYIDNGDGTVTASTCDTLHARPFATITIDGTDYQVTEVVNGQSITFTGSIPAVNTFSLSAPFYFHGTPMMVNNELSEVNAVDKMPLIYLLEILRENFNQSPDSLVERTSDVSLFFLDEANYADWDTDKHYSDVINPMRNMAQSFIDAVNNQNGVGKQENYTIISHANFGIYINNNGHQTPIFSENLSGVELQITLPFLKTFKCDC